MKCLVEAQPRIDIARKLVRLGDYRFERCANEGIAVRLATRQGASIAAEEWQVRSKFLAKGHGKLFSLENANWRRL